MRLFRKKEQPDRELLLHRERVTAACDLVISRLVRDTTEFEFGNVYPADVQKECRDLFGLHITSEEAARVLVWRVSYRGYNPRRMIRGVEFEGNSE